MAVTKVSISLEQDLASRARQEAEAEGRTLSSFVAEAVEYRLKLQAARQVLTEWESEHGAITGAERDLVKSRWPA